MARTRPWTTEQDARIAQLYDKDELVPSQIAERMGRPIQSIRTRLLKLRKEGKVGPARKARRQ